MTRPLSEFVPREVSQRSVNAHWEVAEERLFGKPRTAWAPRFALAGVAMALLVSAGWWMTRQPKLTVGTAWVAAAPSTTTLSDGSRVELAQGATVVLGVNDLDRVELSLINGSATFEVTKNPNRKFVVLSSDVAVEVVGTRFSVHRDRQGLVRVEVERGIVNVYAHGRTRKLEAGQQWSPLAREQDAVAEVEELVEEEPEPEVVIDAGAGSPEPVPSVPTSLKKKKKLRTVVKRVQPEGSAADTLFGQALSARSTRRWQLAAQLAERFLTENPTDPRAGLMAFELGRVLADQLGRRDAAMQAYAKAMRLDPQADFIDDLLVRWAEAAYASGDLSGCAQKRDEYLKRFPRGQLRATVRGICGAP